MTTNSGTELDHLAQQARRVLDRPNQPDGVPGPRTTAALREVWAARRSQATAQDGPPHSIR